MYLDIIKKLREKMLEELRISYFQREALLFSISRKNFPIIRKIYEERDLDIKCKICNNKIVRGERIVLIPISSYFANYKDFLIFHEGCFLLALEERFKGEVKLTKKGKILATICNL